MARRDPEARDGRGADERPTLALREVTRLAGLDRRSGEPRREGRNVRQEIVAVVAVGADQVGRVGQGDGAVWFAAGVDLAKGAGVDLRVDDAVVLALPAAGGAVGRGVAVREQHAGEDGVGGDVGFVDHAVGAEAVDFGFREDAAGPGARGHDYVGRVRDGDVGAVVAVEVLDALDARGRRVDLGHLGAGDDLDASPLGERGHGHGEV